MLFLLYCGIFRIYDKNMEKVFEFLKKAGTYYLATVDGNGQPKVRPFGTVDIFDGKLCIQTGKCKPVAKQIAANPNVEICAFTDGEWIRLSGQLAELDSRDARKHMLDCYPELRRMYNEDDGNTLILYFTSGKAVFSSFTAPSETFVF